MGVGGRHDRRRGLALLRLKCRCRRSRRMHAPRIFLPSPASGLCAAA
jgi:hypothetical protein